MIKKKNFTMILIASLFIMTEEAVMGQTPIRDRAVIAQQERMVFKQWNQNRFYPRPLRVLGIPTNPNWFLTWAWHPNYPRLDRRPLSPAGEQTQRLGLAAAMKISSDYHKQQADTVRNLALREMARISGALSGADPLYLLYYKREFAPLENTEAHAFQNSPVRVRDFMMENGAFSWYLENMNSLKERLELAKSQDMERGQRLLMYHRLLLEMKNLQRNWEHKLSLTGKMLAFQESIHRRKQSVGLFIQPATQEEGTLSGILQRRAILR